MKTESSNQIRMSKVQKKEKTFCRGSIYHAAGNSFFLTEGIPKTNVSVFVKKICRESPGIKLDGAIFLKKNKKIWSWDFRNSDGSKAPMCGNASRISLSYLFLKTKAVQLETAIGEVRLLKIFKKGEILISEVQWHQEISALKISNQMHLVNSGNPHLVVRKESMDQLNSQKALKLRKRFDANVTFFSSSKKNSIQAITFERGVEDFTQSCGTGAAAAAWVFSMQKKVSSRRTKVLMPGGCLEVAFSGGPRNLISLGGPVKKVADVQFNFSEKSSKISKTKSRRV